MGDNNEGASEFRSKIVLEELYRGEVQVIGGLVEQHQVWLRYNRAGEHQPILLTTRELTDVQSVLYDRETERVQDAAGLVAMLRKLLLRQSVEYRSYQIHLYQPVGKKLLDNFQAKATATRDLSFIGRFGTAEQREQR